MWLGFLALLLAGFIGGLSPIFIKFGTREFPPLLLTFLRFLLATIIFAPLFFHQENKLSKKDIFVLSKNSIFFSLNVGIFSIAIQFTTAITSQILYSLVPIIVAVFSYLLLGEKFTRHKIVGLILASIGIAIFIRQSIVGTQVLSFGTPLGNFLNILAVLSWAFYMVLSKKLTKNYTPVTTSFVSFVVTTLLLLFFVPIEYLVHPIVGSKITTVGIGNVLALAIFSSSLMFFLIQFVIKKTSSFTASFFQYLGPFSAGLFSIPIFGEKLSGSLILSGFLIIFGVFYATTFPTLRKKLGSLLK